MSDEPLRPINSDTARAVEETAKAAGKIADIFGKSGSYLGRVMSCVPEDVVGLLIGDWLHHKRIRRWAELEVGTREHIRKLGVEEPFADISPSLAVPLIEDEVDETIIGFLHALPHLRRAAHIVATPRWDSGIGSEMVQGCYDAIAILEDAWLKLAELYPPNHFGDRPTHHFFSDFLTSRFTWYRQIYEPRGPGSAGTIVTEIVSGNVLDDAANAVAETVEGLYVGLYLGDFDLPAWRRAWIAAGNVSMTFALEAAE